MQVLVNCYFRKINEIFKRFISNRLIFYFKQNIYNFIQKISFNKNCDNYYNLLILLLITQFL